MKLLLLFTGLIPTGIAHATGLADIGGGHASPMWTQVCSVLPYCGTSGANGIYIITSIVIQTVLLAIGSAAVLIILYASFRLVTSAGNDETVRKVWKEMIFYAALGLVLAILADPILAYVLNLVGGIAAM
jgi:hypothetical protein